MNLFSQLYLGDFLHEVSQALIVPTGIILVLLIVYCVYAAGGFVYEYFVERRHYTVALPCLIDDINKSDVAGLTEVVKRSGLLDSQKDRLIELISYMHLPEDALTEVARRLLADESERYQKALEPSELAMRAAPMLGLIGTLVPLGPALVALGSGDLEALSSSLLIAFDTTVSGLAVACICLVLSRFRKRWYSGYLISIEGAMNTILEKARLGKTADEATQTCCDGAAFAKGEGGR